MPVTAEQMAPRRCDYCKAEFAPKRPQDWKSAFCCKEHQAQFHIEANRIAAGIWRKQLVTAPAGSVVSQSEFRSGVSHRQQVLDMLTAHPNEWVSRRTLPQVQWNCRVVVLKRQGYVIEFRRAGADYQYRRVM